MSFSPQENFRAIASAGRTNANRSTFFTVALALCLLATSAGSPAAAFAFPPAQPEAAVFYPEEVQMTVEELLVPQQFPSGSGFLLTLPPDVRPETFFLTIDGVPAAESFHLEEEAREEFLKDMGRPAPGGAFLPENETSPERRALLEKVLKAAEEQAAKQGEGYALEQRLVLWRQTLEWRNGDSPRNAGADALTPAGRAAELDAAYAARIPQLYIDMARQNRALHDADDQLQRAARALWEFDQARSGVMMFVPHSGAGKNALKLRYSYVLPALCEISYRLNALPDKEELVVAQDVSLSQSSGFPWEDVEVFVSTARRDRTLRPQPLNPWLISMVSKKEPLEPVMRKAPSAPIQGALADRAYSAEVAAPVQEEKSVFRLWNLGRRRIDDKKTARLALASDTHPARYSYTLRPISNPKGFLTAELSLDTGLELPPGMAQFLVDGLMIGQRRFSFDGNRGAIYFGTDPQVTAAMRNLRRISGKQGFFSKDETLLWHWEFTLKNTRSKPVRVVLEDPAPSSRDSAITVSVDSRPAPEERVNAPEQGGARVFLWKVTLKPGEPCVIEHKVKAAVPQSGDAVLNPGREAWQGGTFD